MQITNENNQSVGLQFYTQADGNKLPAGTYPINGTKEENTVLASKGYDGNGYTYSLALDQASNNTWFMVGGEIIVAEDGSITVNAYNSYDKAITINITAPATGLFNLDANAAAIRKALIKGHIVIFKNNKMYNLHGAEL